MCIFIKTASLKITASHLNEWCSQCTVVHAYMSVIHHMYLDKSYHSEWKSNAIWYIRYQFMVQSIFPFFGWDSAFFPFSFCLNRQLTSAIWITKSKVTRAWNSTSIHMGSFHQPYFALVKHFYIRGSSIWSSLMRIRMVLHAQPAAIKRRDFISDYVIEKHFILKHSFFSNFDFT